VSTCSSNKEAAVQRQLRQDGSWLAHARLISANWPKSPSAETRSPILRIKSVSITWLTIKN